MSKTALSVSYHVIFKLKRFIRTHRLKPRLYILAVVCYDAKT